MIHGIYSNLVVERIHVYIYIYSLLFHTLPLICHWKLQAEFIIVQKSEVVPLFVLLLLPTWYQVIGGISVFPPLQEPNSQKTCNACCLVTSIVFSFSQSTLFSWWGKECGHWIQFLWWRVRWILTTSYFVPSQVQNLSSHRFLSKLDYLQMYYCVFSVGTQPKIFLSDIYIYTPYLCPIYTNY